MPKVGNSNLPSGTNVENLLSLIAVLKKNNKNEENIKALFKMGDSVYGCTKSALKAFGILDNDSLEFTPLGREIAYSGEDSKKEEIIKIVKGYEPYELVLNSISTARNEVKETEIDTIKNLWGKAEYGSTDRNRKDGATLFMSIIEYIGFGKYIIGRGKYSTRIEWVDDIKKRIEEFLVEDTAAIKELSDIESLNNNPEIDEMKDTTPENSDSNFKEENVDIPKVNNLTKGIMPNLTINVDMSDWSDEKIKTFFKYAYGKFEED